METDIRKIFRRVVITIISILLIIFLNFYLEKRQESWDKINGPAASTFPAFIPR